MKNSILLIAAIAFILSACGQTKKAEAANAAQHNTTTCTDHDHSTEGTIQNTASQETFIADTTDSVKDCSTEQCAGCTHACTDKVEVAESSVSDQGQHHDDDGNHTHN